MKLVNLTPHPITLQGEDTKVTIPPSGKVARVVEEQRASALLAFQGDKVDGDKVDDLIPIYSVPLVDLSVRKVVDLPDPEDGTLYIVSRPVALALAGTRADVVVPDDFVRDDQGRIIAARRLARFIKS